MKRLIALVVGILMLALSLTGCATDMYGYWVDESDGTIYHFDTYTVDIGGETYEYEAADGTMVIYITNEMLGMELTAPMTGQYKIRWNSMHIIFDDDSELDLRRY